MSEVVALNTTVRRRMLDEFAQERHASYAFVMDHQPSFASPIVAIVEDLYIMLSDGGLKIAGGPYRLDYVFKCIGQEAMRVELSDGGYRIRLLRPGTRGLTRQFDVTPEMKERAKEIKPFLALEVSHLNGRPPFTGRLSQELTFERAAVLRHYTENDVIPTHLGIALMVDIHLSGDTKLKLGTRRISSTYDELNKRFESNFVSKELHYALEIDIDAIEKEDADFNRRHQLVDGIAHAM